MMLSVGGFCWGGARGMCRPCGAAGAPGVRASAFSGNNGSSVDRDLLVPAGDRGFDGDE